MDSGSGSGSGSDSGSGAAIYLVNGSPAEYICIDLDCGFPMKVSPITRFDDEISPGWTVVDKCIYCIGGCKDSDKSKAAHTAGKTLHKYKDSVKSQAAHTAGKTLHKYNTTSSTSTWECIVSNRILRWCDPFVFAFERKIYVVGGNHLSPDYECDKDTDWTYPGEYYDLDSEKWNLMPKLDVDIGVQHFSNFNVSRVMDDQRTLLFYSSHDGTFLFYDLVEDAWKHNRRINNALLWVMEGLQECYCVDVLFTIVNVTKPVVCDSTLYWFNNDMCLYGFEYIRKRWFRSNTLHPQLLWPSLSVDRSSLCDMALLFYLNNQTFVAVSGADGVLDLAIINVERDKDSLSISLKSSGNIEVETSHSFIVFMDGMTIGKDEGSTTTNNNMPSIIGKDEGSVLGTKEYALVD